VAESPAPPPPLVAYYRVSTKKQGDSGLGLEGQAAAVAAFARAAGRPLLRAFTETESGKRSDRPELRKALAHARRAKGTLVVAKLDRLSRNVAFLSTLMEAAVDFVCVDNPHATPFTLHILAAVAEFEARAISERTKAGLAAYKARGGVLGSHRAGSPLTRADRLKGGVLGRRTLREAAVKDYADLLPEMLAWRGEGLTLRAIAARLNEAGHSTRGGAAWGPVQVRRVLDRAAPPSPGRGGLTR
jgi:DNA invertase Pin-like site-specific DNA recombinase